jgi:hypothetical protein
MTSFGGEVKPSAPCRKILLHVKELLRYDADSDRQNSMTIFAQFLPTLLLGVCAAAREENSGG